MLYMALWRNWQYAWDLKSQGLKNRVGSTPTRATNKAFFKMFLIDIRVRFLIFHVYLYVKYKMASKIKNRIEDELFIKTCESSSSMAKACANLKLHFNSFKKRAIELGCYKTNQAGVGLEKRDNGTKIPLSEILKGLHPSYQTNKLRIRLIEEGVKENKCEECKLDSWCEKPLSLELDHIDGDRTNHKLKNLKILCPNCHSQTSTYRSKNKKK